MLYEVITIAGAVYCYGDKIVQVTDLGAATTLFDGGYSSDYPYYADIAVGPSGVLYAAQTTNGYNVKKLDGSTLTTVVGAAWTSESFTYETISSLSATSIRLEQLSGLAFSAGGTLYTAESCGRVLAVRNGTGTRYAGGVASSQNSFDYFFV